jgi:hypothetical protein
VTHVENSGRHLSGEPACLALTQMPGSPPSRPTALLGPLWLAWIKPQWERLVTHRSMYSGKVTEVQPSSRAERRPGRAQNRRHKGAGLRNCRNCGSDATDLPVLVYPVGVPRCRQRQGRISRRHSCPLLTTGRTRQTTEHPDRLTQANVGPRVLEPSRACMAGLRRPAY